MKTALLALTLLAALPASARAQPADPAGLIRAFLAAWDASDAKALAALFAPDADFVSPAGDRAQGRADIEGFYAAAFARGYAGSKGMGEIVHQRSLGADLVLIDGRFAIRGARQPDGSPRQEEKGIMAAVLGRDGGAWRILALRENEGAGQFTAFPPAR